MTTVDAHLGPALRGDGLPVEVGRVLGPGPALAGTGGAGLPRLLRLLPRHRTMETRLRQVSTAFRSKIASGLGKSHLNSLNM